MRKNNRPIYGDKREMYHPVHKKLETARFIGYYGIYAQYEFISDGLVVLGEIKED